jgi:hypothetical protein
MIEVVETVIDLSCGNNNAVVLAEGGSQFNFKFTL